MSTILFVADASKYGIPCNDKEGITLDGKKYANGEFIMRTGPYKCHDLKKDLTTEKGQILLDSEADKERIQWIKNYPDYGKKYIERTILPRETFQNGSVVNGAERLKESNVDIKAIQNASVQKTIRYMELKQKYYKLDGELKATVDKEDTETSAELTEYETLKKELNL